MKAGIFLVSLLAMAGSWYWISHRQGRSLPLPQQLKNALKSIVIGIAVYFSLLFVVLVYLMASTL